MILMIDNYDSFTYNLVQYFGELGQQIDVVRNDAITIAEIERMRPSMIVISPGPCTPNEAGMSLAIIEYFAGRIPIFGVCLGHQAIAQAFGGNVVRAERLMHGKTSKVFHENDGVHRNMPNPYVATRYHSLIVERETLPESLVITAETEAGEIMGIRHQHFAVEGVQFHPESMMTEKGLQLLQNFIETYVGVH